MGLRSLTEPRRYHARVLAPSRGDATQRFAPLAVATIALLDVALFVWLARQDPAQATASVDAYGLVPREWLRAVSGAGGGAARRLSPLTSMFLHVDALHLAGNVLYLWIFGAALEARIGSLRFAAFFLVCGLAASLLHVASAPGSYLPAVGASGAISGLLGAYAASRPRRRLRLVWPPLEVPAFALFALWIVLQALSALAGRGEPAGAVAGWAHVGGFLAGALCARLPGAGALRAQG
jgi:membrane associated rhomboid family serine protease